MPDAPPSRNSTPPRPGGPLAEETRSAPGSAHAIDALIVGGGIAGLWLLNVLTRRGYSAVLLEADALGCGQTLASQGMIHGGIKYALSGSLTGASEAIAGMPERWAACLEGRGEVDLTGLTPLAPRYHLFAAASTLGRLTTFFAGRALRGRIRRLEPEDYPAGLADPGFSGHVYELREFVLDTTALLETLRRPVADRIYRYRLPDQPGLVELTGRGATLAVNGTRLDAGRLILAAGAGNEALLAAVGLDAPRMQRRPLHQTIVRAPDLPPLFAHCLTGIRRPEPRLTITSHRDGAGWLWYLGGQLATDGVAMADAELREHARAELAACIPWRSWRDAWFASLRVDRAEPANAGGTRPDEAFAAATGPGGTCIVAWPTKLSLAPDLGDRVLALLPPPSGAHVPRLDLPAAAVGSPAWERKR
jgi:glycine/D-amino acid oxidase-like deaminating enzyme